MKHAKAQMIKKQREAHKRHEEVIQQKRREVEALRKADRTLQRRIGRLQLENRGHKLIMDRKDHCIKTLKQKAANAETHVIRLLQLQNKNREPAHRRGKIHLACVCSIVSIGANVMIIYSMYVYVSYHTAVQGRPRAGGKVAAAAAKGKADVSSSAVTVDSERVQAARFLMEKMVEERLGDLETRRSLEQKVCPLCLLD